MFRAEDGYVFHCVTGGLRKPVVRFYLASGRQVELLGFHLEPALDYTGETWAPTAERVARRLYPIETPVIAGDMERVPSPAFLCVAYFYSDSPARNDRNRNYSSLLLCGLVENIDKGIRGIVCNLLSQVDWESSATDDFLW